MGLNFGRAGSIFQGEISDIIAFLITKYFRMGRYLDLTLMGRISKGVEGGKAPKRMHTHKAMGIKL